MIRQAPRLVPQEPLLKPQAKTHRLTTSLAAICVAVSGAIASPVTASASTDSESEEAAAQPTPSEKAEKLPHEAPEFVIPIKPIPSPKKSAKKSRAQAPVEAPKSLNPDE
jgi:hypothetical protein